MVGRGEKPNSKRENESTKNGEESTAIYSIFLFFSCSFLFLSLAFLSCRLPAVPVAAGAAGLLEWLFISGMKKTTTSSTVAFLCKQLQLNGCINKKKGRKTRKKFEHGERHKGGKGKQYIYHGAIVSHRLE